MKYYSMEPFGAVRDNLHAAQIAAILANAHRDPKKSKPVKVSDFMYKDHKTQLEENTSEMLSFLRMKAKPQDG